MGAAAACRYQDQDSQGNQLQVLISKDGVRHEYATVPRACKVWPRGEERIPLTRVQKAALAALRFSR